MTDPAFQRLGLPATASPYAVLRAAVRALHPDTRASASTGRCSARMPRGRWRATRQTA